MTDIYKVVNELKALGYPDNVLYKYNFLEFVPPKIDAKGMDDLLNSIENITDTDKELFFMRYKKCMTCVEIAKEKGLTTGRVTGRIERVVFLLIKQMKEQDFVKEKPVVSDGKLRIRL